MNKTDIQTAQNLLARKQKIAILPHRNPDGDAMGSTLGLSLFLQELGHEVYVISPNEFPDFLAWMPQADKVVIFEKETEKANKILAEVDLVFTLDFNVLHRVGELMEEALKKLSVPFLMIDHHEKPDDYATFMFSDIKYGSTCEMVYHFISLLGNESLINQQIATCLYTGIVTDSGSFKYPNTTSTTHRVVASLIDKGVKNTETHQLIFDNNSFNKLKLLGRALENMVVLPHLKTAYILLSQKDLDEFHFQKGDTEGIVNYPLTIKDIVFSVIFIENSQEKIIKMSFRSQGNFDVNLFARNYFSGGGHKNAAGGKSGLSMKESITRFLEVLANDNPAKL
ncbi:MAG: bifunctional oligoribonuclease/PAP phosphatase NrnA [Flavobacteriaceae bacterium]